MIIIEFFFFLLLSSLLISASSHNNFSQYVCVCMRKKIYYNTSHVKIENVPQFFFFRAAAHTFQFLCSVFAKLFYVEWFISGTSYTRWKTMNQKKIIKRRRNNSKSNRSDCYCTQVSIHEVWRQPSNARTRKRGRWRRKQMNRSRKMNINFSFGLPLYRIETKYPS